MNISSVLTQLSLGCSVVSFTTYWKMKMISSGGCNIDLKGKIHSLAGDFLNIYSWCSSCVEVGEFPQPSPLSLGRDWARRAPWDAQASGFTSSATGRPSAFPFPRCLAAITHSCSGTSLPPGSLGYALPPAPSAPLRPPICSLLALSFSLSVSLTLFLSLSYPSTMKACVSPWLRAVEPVSAKRLTDGKEKGKYKLLFFFFFYL